MIKREIRRWLNITQMDNVKGNTDPDQSVCRRSEKEYFAVSSIPFQPLTAGVRYGDTAVVAVRYNSFLFQTISRKCSLGIRAELP